MNIVVAYLFWFSNQNHKSQFVTEMNLFTKYFNAWKITKAQNSRLGLCTFLLNEIEISCVKLKEKIDFASPNYFLYLSNYTFGLFYSSFIPERREFPLDGNHMEKGSFQDGNPIELCCKLVVSMWFLLCFPWREIPFFTQW